MTLFIKYKTAFYLLFFATGILSKNFLNPSDLTVICLVIPIILITIRYPPLHFILFFFLGFSLLPDYQPEPEVEKLIGKKITASGTLIKNPELRTKSTRLFIRLENVITQDGNIDVNSKIVAYLENKDSSLNYGDAIKIDGIRLKKIKNFNNPGGFDIKAFYKRKNIFFSAYIENKNIKVIGRGQRINPFLYPINRLRSSYSWFVRKNISYPESSVINALTVGDKGNIPENTREIFSGLGIAHIFAISGLHVGAIAVGFYFLFKWVLKRSEYILLTFQMPTIAALLTIFPVFVYTALAGFSISSVRAFIMTSIFLLSIVIGRDDYKLNTLFLAALVILIANPNSIFDLAFQLSFLSVFGILFIHSFYPLEIKSRVDKFKTAVKTTIAATVFTLPITVNTFGYLPALSIPANLLLIPVVELVIVPLGLISLITFKIFMPLSLLILNINTHFISLVLRATEYIDSIGIARITLPSISPKITVSVAITSLIVMFRKKFGEFYYILLSVALILSTAVVINNFYKPGRDTLEINLFDSGTKNITLIRTADSETVLISGGFSFKSDSDFIEKAVVAPYLLSTNTPEVDHLVLTSLDKSHLNGTAALLKKIRVNNIWINGHKLKNSLWEEIYQKNIKVHKIPKESSTIPLEGTKLNLLRPKSFPVYDSKMPAPLLIQLRHHNYAFYTGEKIESDGFNINKSDLLFINENKNTNFDSIIRKYKPDVIVCRDCNIDMPKEKTNIYRTANGGMVTVSVKNKKIDIRKYIEK